ncbi:MAG: YeiH family protein [Bryobacteraceae bacterium]
MSFFKTSAHLSSGVLLSLLAALAVWWGASLSWNHGLQLSPLTLAILAGMLMGNAIPPRFLDGLHPGLRFAQQKILRFGIILYGLRLTVYDVFQLGPGAVALDVAVIGCVVIAGYWLGTRVFKLDPDTALLVSAGSGICGAAAVLATDRVIDSESHKASIAVATVVVFGTIAMFLYPLLYPFTGFTERQFGIYTGATVHEVAQVVAAGRAVSQAATDTAVVTKMLRVLLLAPVLLLVGRVRRSRAAGASHPISFPWFVLWFGAVIAVQSLYTPPASVRSGLIEFDTVLLSSAMFALGVGTRWSQLSRAGTRPLLLAAVLFAGLVGGGFLLTRLLIG